MDVAAAGQLIIFFSVLVGMILVGGLVLAYLGYSFLHVLISTAAGNDEIAWPGDPFFDWMFKGWYLAWIAVMSGLPGLLIIFTAHIHANDPRWAVLLAGSVCLCFPVFLLSSMSGSSRMLLARGEIIAGMLRRFGLTVCFYFLTSIVVVGCAAFAWFAIVEWPIAVVPVAMIIVAIGALIYARMLGRLGHAIAEEPASEKNSKQAPERGRRSRSSKDKWGVPEIPLPSDSKPKSRPAAKKPRAKPSSAEVMDPWAVPELEPPKPRRKKAPADDPYGPSEEGYGVEAPRKKTRVDRPAKTGPVPAAQDSYSMAADELPPPTKPAPAPAHVEVSSYEAALAAPKQRPDLPANPLLSGVLTFPFYPTTLGPFVTIAMGLSLLGLLGRALLALFPS